MQLALGALPEEAERGASEPIERWAATQVAQLRGLLSFCIP